MRGIHWAPLGVILLLALGVSSQPAQAELTFFTDRSAWETEVGAFETEDFNEVALQTVAVGPGFTFSKQRVGKVSIGAKGDRLGDDWNPSIRDTDDQRSPNGTRHLGGMLSNFEVIMQAAITFDQPVTAFGADWASATNRTGVTLAIGDQIIPLSDHLAGDGNGFFGIVAPFPFQQVFLSTRAVEEYGLDNLSFQVPEPAGCTLLLLGVVLLATFKPPQTR